MARQVVVDIVGDSTKFQKSLDAASGKAGKFGGLAKTGFGMGVGLGVFGLVSDAIGGVTTVLGDAKQAYQEDVASQDKLKTALQNNVKGWDGHTEAIEKVITARQQLGFEDGQQRDSLSLLLGSTHDITKAQELQAAAMDLARLKNIDLTTATGIMVKANEGSYGGLKKLGIEVDKNATSTEMLAAVTEVAGGQAQAYADGPLGKQEAAQLKVGESMEQIGEVVSDVSSVVLPILADAFVGIVDLLGQVWDAVQPVIETLANNLGPVVQTIGEIFGDVVATITDLWNEWGDEIMGVVSVVGGFLSDTIGNFMQVIQGIIQTVTSLIKGDWQGAWDGIKNIFKGVWDQIKNVVDTALTFIKGLISTVWNGIKGTISDIINGIKTTISNVWNGIVGAVRTALSNLKGNITNIWNGIRDFISGIINGIKTTLTNIWNGIVGAIQTALNNMKNNITNAFNGIVDFVTHLPGRMASALGNLFAPLWNGFKGFLNNIIRGWNSLKFTIPGFDIGPVHYGGISVGTPNIPLMHAGGIVPGRPGATVPILMQAGEQVIPRKDVGRGGDVHIHIGTFIGSGPDIDRLADLIAMRMRTAPRLGV